MNHKVQIEYTRLQSTALGGRLFWLCWMMYTVSYLGRYNYSGVMKEMIDSGCLTVATGSAIATGYFALYGIGQFVHGIAGSKASPFRMMLLGILVAGVSNLLMPFCQSWRSMALLWAINGFAQAMTWPAIIRIMADLMPCVQIERACIHICSSVTVGTLGAYAITIFCLQKLRWQAVFSIAGISMLAAAALWRRFAYPIGAQLERHPAAARKGADARDIRKEYGALLRPMLLSGALLLLLPTLAHGMIRDGITTWIPLYLADEFSITTSQAVAVTMLLPVINLSGAYLADFINRRIKNEVLTASALFCLAVLAILGLLFFSKINVFFAALLFSAITAAMCGVNTMLINLLPVKLGKNGGGTFYAGLSNCSAYLGGALSSLAVAAVLSIGNWREVNLLWCGIGIASAAVCFACGARWRSFIKDAPPHPPADKPRPSQPFSMDGLVEKTN